MFPQIKLMKDGPKTSNNENNKNSDSKNFNIYMNN